MVRFRRHKTRSIPVRWMQSGLCSVPVAVFREDGAIREYSPGKPADGREEFDGIAVRSGAVRLGRGGPSKKCISSTS